MTEIYKPKSENEWRHIIKNSMPQGFLWEGVGLQGTVIDTLLNSMAKILSDRDNIYAQRFNSLKLSPDSQFLDEYWDMFGISQWIKERPTNNEKKYKIINAFAKASKGLSTSKQIEDFINDVFDLEIDIYISDIKTSEYNNRFPCKFSFKFASFDIEDNTVVIKLPQQNDSSDDNVLPTADFPFKLINRDNYSEAIKMLLNIIIDIDFKIVYI